MTPHGFAGLESTLANNHGYRCKIEVGILSPEDVEHEVQDCDIEEPVFAIRAKDLNECVWVPMRRAELEAFVDHCQSVLNRTEGETE